MLLNSVVLARAGAGADLRASLLIRRAPTCAARPRRYITEGATYSRINTTLTETVEGARTVEALGLPRRRSARATTTSRCPRRPSATRCRCATSSSPRSTSPSDRRAVITLLVGAYAYARGWVDLGQITAAVLYVEALADPLDRLIGEVDRLQVGRGVDEPAARHRRGQAGPHARRPAARRHRPRGRGPALRLPRGPRRAARDRPAARHGRAAGHRRSQRVGEVDAGPPAVGHQPAAYGVGERRRCRPGRPAAGGAAHGGRPRDAGAPRLHRLGARQHRAGPRGLRRRRRPRGAERGRLAGCGSSGSRRASTR